jgi:hypothetical protein
MVGALFAAPPAPAISERESPHQLGRLLYGAMVPPIWPDEQGRPLPTYPYPRPGCGREEPVRFKGFRVEHRRHVGWQAYQVERYVDWTGAGTGRR